MDRVITGLSFLAVDDDPLHLAILSSMMLSLGYCEPKTVDNGLDALSILQDRNNHTDCILLDIQMPGIDGIATCKRIRQISHHVATPIIMVTTLIGRNFVDNAFAAGATDYLTKPLDRIELSARLGMMERLISERRKAGSLERDMSSLSDIPGIGFAFDDPSPLPKSDGLLDYLALENHLLTSGRLSNYGLKTIAFQVVDASKMYQLLEPVEYLDYMADIGRSLVASLKRYSFMLAHAGSGEFVCILGHRQTLDADELKQDLSIQLLALHGNYVDLGLPLPFVKIGAVQSLGLYSSSMVKRFLTRARVAVRSIE